MIKEGIESSDGFFEKSIASTEVISDKNASPLSVK